MYIKLDGRTVIEIIPDIDPTFPDVTVKKRFPADFIAELIHVEDDTAVEVGMEYDAETDSFGYPESDIRTDVTEEIVEDTGGITQAEINLDVEYRLACLELGIN